MCVMWEQKKTYPLLCELTGTLVLAVTEQFNDSALVWCETIEKMISRLFTLEKNGRNIPRNLLDDISDKRSALAQVTLGSANLGLGDTSLGFLYHIINQPVHLLKNFAKKILQEVRRAGFFGFPVVGKFHEHTCPLLRPTARPVRACFSAAIVDVGVGIVVLSMIDCEREGEILKWWWNLKIWKCGHV